MNRKSTLLPILQLLLPILILLQPAAVIADEQCPRNLSRPAPDNAHQVNDVLWAGSPERSYPKAAYRSVPGGGYVLCTCEIEICILKCCGPNMIFGPTGCGTFNETLDNFSKVPKFVNENGTVDTYETDQFHIVHGKLNCTSKYQLNPLENEMDSFRINKTGWLLDEFEGIIVSPGTFCLETFSLYDYQVLPIVCSSESKVTPNAPDTQNQGGNIIYTIGMIISLIFLFSTFLVYALIKDLRNLHGKSLMCHVAMLMAAYISLITIQLDTDVVKNEWCVYLAYSMQFFFLGSFFWLNVMCFDVWQTFSGPKLLRRHKQKDEAKKFIIYSMYAWGCTSVISIFTFTMDKYKLLNIRPEFGVDKCWFKSEKALLLYFYGPIGILLLSNLLMFIHTTITIVKLIKNAGDYANGSRNQRKVNREKQRFMLCLELFIVMGINWLMEILSWAIGGSNIVWNITDIGNTLQGVFIFLIFVCKKRVLHLLNKNFCPQFKIFEAVNSSNETTNSNVSENSSDSQNNDAVLKLT